MQDVKKWSDEFQVGQEVVWPNGVAGEVRAIDRDDDQLLDQCGGWHNASHVDAA